jgi:hypothetical protein
MPPQAKEISQRRGKTGEATMTSRGKEKGPG